MAGLAALPTVFMDFTIAGVPAGRIELQLNKTTVPRTAENFRCLCTGEKGFGYRGSVIHSVVPGYRICGGDFQNGDGTGGRSIFPGGEFDDENFDLSHSGAGILSMVNRGPDSNRSQFMITSRAIPWLDGKNVVFGKLVATTREESLKVLARLERAGSQSGKTTHEIVIDDCGQLA